MSEISEFADRHIFPAVFEIADKIFPEFAFKRHGNKWISGNKRKIDGSEGDKVGKVYLYEDRPYYLKDFTRGGIAIPKYLENHRNNCARWIDAIEHLSRETSIPLPEKDLSQEDIERIEKKDREVELFEYINDFFIISLLDEKSSETDSIRQYLRDKRGYADLLPESHDEIHAPNKMELGLIPSREKLKEYLKGKAFNSDEIESYFKNIGIGTTNKITIPLRCMGKIIGFAFRANVDNQEPKYLYSSTERSSFLLGLKRPKNNNKDLIIFEGVLDILSLQARGIENIAALGSTSLNFKQIELIKRSGYESITLCLDNDEPGRDGTRRAIDESLKQKLRVYVATLPEEFKDPDELIRSQGLDSFHAAIKNANAWYSYLLQQRFEKYNELGEIPDKERDSFFKEAISISNKIESSFDLDIFIKKLEVLGKPFGVSKETIDEEVRIKREKIKQIVELKKATDQANLLIDSGKIAEAIDLLGNISKQSNMDLSRASYDELFKPITREDVIANLDKESDSLDTGFKINKSPLLLPSGATTYIAGRTGRGKTATLINIAVNSLNEISDHRPIVFFSYEENSRKILIKILNTYIGKKFSENNRQCIKDHYSQRDARFISTEMRNEFLRIEKNFFDFFISTGRLIIVDSQDYSDELINKIYYLHKNKNVRAVLIDYIQRINLKDRKKDRHEELKIICNHFVDCAIKTGLPIIAGAQFNRQATDDRNTLTLTNLGEAGDIERSANMVLAVDIKHNDTPNQPSEFYMKVIKNRDGVAEIFDTLNYDGNTGKISNHSLIGF